MPDTAIPVVTLPLPRVDPGNRDMMERAEQRARSLKEVNDGDLIAAFAGGNEEAFAELYHRHRVEVYRYILALTRGDADLAHDMFQETFLKVYEHAGTLREGNNTRNWMFSIARNSCISHFRRSSRQVPFEIDRDDIADDTLPSPDEVLEHLERYAALDEAIARLPLLQRHALMLREFSGHSYAEIARLTDTNIGIVRQRIWRAKQTLRTLLASRLEDRPGEQI